MRVSVLFFVFLGIASQSSSAKRKITLAEHIDIVSTNVVEGMAIDRTRVAKTLFMAFRPKVKVTNEGLSVEEIDQRVKDYIEKSFVLAMVAEYVKIYGQVKNASAKISRCGKPDFFSTRDKTREALCIDRFQKRILVLHHLVQEPKKQRLKSVYTFEGKVLVGVSPRLKKNVDVIIDGL